MRARLTAGLLLTVVTSSAWAGPFREIERTDGLVVRGEIVESRADGFIVGLSQGDLRVSFDDVADLRDLDAAPEAAPWVVSLTAEGPVDVLMRSVLGQVADVGVWAPDALPDMRWRTAAAGCAGAPGCVQAASPAGSWSVALGAAVVDGDLWLEGATPWRRGAQAVRVPLDGLTMPVLVAATAEALSMVRLTLRDDPAQAGAAEAALGVLVRNAPSDTAWTPGRVAALSFIPVPGLPSILQKRPGAFAGALAVTAASTAAWVGATGYATTSSGEHAALGAAGAYLCSVASSQLFGQLGVQRPERRTAVVMTATPLGQTLNGIDGAMLSVVVIPTR